MNTNKPHKSVPVGSTRRQPEHGLPSRSGFFFQIPGCKCSIVYFYAVKWCFKADVEGVLLTLTAERIYRSKQAERYRLTIAGTGSTLIIQNNRPAVEAKKNGKEVQWYVVEGPAQHPARLDAVYKQLERAIDGRTAFIQGTLNFIDHF